MVALLTTSLFGATRAAADPPADVAGSPSAGGVQPEIAKTRSSNDTCAQLGFDHGLSISGNGSASAGDVSVTVSGFNSPAGSVDWSSSVPVHGVYVKGGPSGGNLFPYPSGATGDEDLHTPQKAAGGFYAVGHVAACWNDVAAAPDVTVQKSTAPVEPVAPGGEITYTLRVSNVGNANAAAVHLTDQLPAGVSFVPGGSESVCNEDAATRTVTCALGDIDTGASLNTRIVVTVDEGHCAPIENVAHVSAANEVGTATENNDSNTVMNSVTCATLLQEELPPDLRVTKTSDVDADVILHPGDVIRYTITVTNVGDVTATGVRLVDVLPVGATGVDGVPSFGGEFCIVTSSLPPGGVPHAEVRCGPIPIGPGVSASVTIAAHVTDDACGEITNEVDVTGSNEPDEHVGPDNHGEAGNEIACVPRIRVVKSGPRRAHVGDTVTYRFTVKNTGGVPLSDIELTDPKCDGSVTLVDDGNGNAVLGVGEVWRYRCHHRIAAGDGDPAHGVAKVAGDHEGGSVSDTDAQAVDVLHPDIRIEKTASPASGTPGADVVYTYVVTNTGDAMLFDISVDDELRHVGDVVSLAPGASFTRTYGIVLGSSPLTSVATASGSDALGMSVTDTDDASVAVVAGGNPEGGSDDPGTPFTGFAAGPLSALVVALGGLGAILLGISRRARTRLAHDPRGEPASQA
jgi:uncharacterized repeat protein (TIGR01451 family)